MLLLLIVLCIFPMDLAESDIQVIIENIEMTVNKEYFEFCNASPCENDDMMAVFSFDCKLIKALPVEGSMKAILLEMVNGEPTEPTGVDIDISFEQMMKDTAFVGPLLSAMNIPLVWPIEPVHMSIECYTPPMENFPEFFPPGEYKFSFNLQNDESHFLLMDMQLKLF